MIPCQACILCPSCHRTLTLIKEIQFLNSIRITARRTRSLSFTTIKLIPSLKQVFKHIPQTNYVFDASSLGEARQSVLSSVRMVLAEFPDTKRMSLGSIEQLACPIAQYYSFISPAISQAIESYLPFRTAVFSVCFHYSFVVDFYSQFYFATRQIETTFLPSTQTLQ